MNEIIDLAVDLALLSRQAANELLRQQRKTNKNWSRLAAELELIEGHKLLRLSQILVRGYAPDDLALLRDNMLLGRAARALIPNLPEAAGALDLSLLEHWARGDTVGLYDLHEKSGFDTEALVRVREALRANEARICPHCLEVTREVREPSCPFCMWTPDEAVHDEELLRLYRKLPRPSPRALDFSLANLEDQARAILDELRFD